jgi:hypothetical protein
MLAKQLDDLDKRENELLAMVGTLEGSIEERNILLQNLGVFEAYRRIHSHYAEIAYESLEALKRGLFIQWYAMVEPSFCSGISDIEQEAGNSIISILNNQITQDGTDPELHCMVSYYAGWEGVFTRFHSNVGLSTLLSNKPNYDYILDQMKHFNLDHRGQMGLYWKSIVE